jgi:hypothetical protein
MYLSARSPFLSYVHETTVKVYVVACCFLLWDLSSRSRPSVGPRWRGRNHEPGDGLGLGAAIHSITRQARGQRLRKKGAIDKRMRRAHSKHTPHAAWLVPIACSRPCCSASACRRPLPRPRPGVRCSLPCDSRTRPRSSTRTHENKCSWPQVRSRVTHDNNDHFIKTGSGQT